MIVAEFLKADERIVTTPEQRIWFMKNRRPFPESRVWISRCVDFKWRLAINQQTSGHADLEGAVLPPDTQTTAFGLGQLFILGATTARQGALDRYGIAMDTVSHLKIVRPIFRRLWPYTGREISGPVPSSLSDTQCLKLARVSRAFDFV
jgi:hypothetical protein